MQFSNFSIGNLLLSTVLVSYSSIAASQSVSFAGSDFIPSVHDAMPLFETSGKKKFGEKCSDGPSAVSNQCESGLCGDSCSSARGSCMCPVSQVSPTHCLGPYGKYEMGKDKNCNVCCGLLNTDNGPSIDSDPKSACDRVATVEDKDGVVYPAACSQEPQHRETPDVTYPLCYGAPRGRGFLDDTKYPGQVEFSKLCYHWSDCASGICATGCDCPSEDTNRVFHAQPCSCNCIKPSKKDSSGLTDPKKETYQTSTCGIFTISDETEGSFCPPCTYNECNGHSITQEKVNSRGGWLCLEGERASEQHPFPAYWLTTKTSATGIGKCTKCCNANFCCGKNGCNRNDLFGMQNPRSGQAMSGIEADSNECETSWTSDDPFDLVTISATESSNVSSDENESLNEFRDDDDDDSPCNNDDDCYRDSSREDQLLTKSMRGRE